MATSDDTRVREQSRNGDTGTFLSHTHIDDAGGRFAAVNAAKVVGQSPGIAASYPAASAAHQTALPPEEPLGYSVDAMPLETSVSPSAGVTGEPTPDASSSSVASLTKNNVERGVGSLPPSQGADDNG
jgi:hypothetical protein